MTGHQKRIMYLCYRFLIRSASQCQSNRDYLIEHIKKIMSRKSKIKNIYFGQNND
jgi:hypothetical protein